MSVKNISSAILGVGVDDTTIDLFESQYPVPTGVSYNSYVIRDEKIAILDTVDDRATDEWLANVTEALAIACYVGASPAGFVAVHKRASSHSQVVARLTEYMMVSEGRRVRERDGWIHVRWSKTQLSQAAFERGKGDGKGWIRREEIRGECED